MSVGCKKHGNIHCTDCAEADVTAKLRAKAAGLESDLSAIRETVQRWRSGRAAAEDALSDIEDDLDRSRVAESPEYRWKVGARVPCGNGKSKTEEVEVVGTRADADEALWSVIEGLGVESWTEAQED